MNFIGVDLHKKSITVCVMDQNRKVLARKTIASKETDEIVAFFRKFQPFKVVVEATASYPWFVELVEPLADKVVLANPKKLRVIAESTKKTDRLDAQILAEFLVLDMIPQAYQPTPRQREHRTLVRHRQFLQSRITSVRSKIHHILSNYNADRKDLFSAQGGPAHFKEVPLSDADRFVIKQLWAEWQEHIAQRDALTKKIKAFVTKAPQREKEDRALLMTAPAVGFVTTEVVLSELAGYERFRNSQTVCAYAGLAPAVRQSGNKRSKDMRITKEGSPLLRWALVESAWRLVRSSPRWAARYARLKERKGKKRAIVAVARKLLCVLYAMLRTRTPYQVVMMETKAPRTPRKRLVLVRTSTAEQTTATPTATPTTTHQNPATATAREQVTTTETTKPGTTRKNLKATTTEQTTTTQTAKPKTARKNPEATTTEQTTTTQTAKPKTARKNPEATTTKQTTTTQTAKPKTARKNPEATTTEQTTTTQTTKPRATRESSVKTPAGAEPITTETTAPKTTRRRSAKPPTGEQITTV